MNDDNMLRFSSKEVDGMIWKPTILCARFVVWEQASGRRAARVRAVRPRRAPLPRAPQRDALAAHVGLVRRAAPAALGHDRRQPGRARRRTRAAQCRVRERAVATRALGSRLSHITAHTRHNTADR